MERINVYCKFYKLIILYIDYYSSTYLALNPTPKTVPLLMIPMAENLFGSTSSSTAAQNNECRIGVLADHSC